MKVKFSRLLALLLSCVFVLGTFSQVSASSTSARASDYFSYTDVWATSQGNGKFLVEFDINATHKMLQLGADKIYIWEQQSDGSYDNVKTYTSGLIDTNTAASYRRITYSGTPGVKYYATVVLYAKDSDGSEKLYSSTNVITA